jgi:hypothetical protein
MMSTTPTPTTDTERLDWVLLNRNFRVQGNDAKGWCILDCSKGLTFITKGHPTARLAIDAAMEVYPLQRS